MCYPEPPYVFTDPSEVELAYRVVYLFPYINKQLKCRFGCALFELAAKGHDINKLLRQLRSLIIAWRYLCGVKCDWNCYWYTCYGRKLKDLIRTAEEYEGVAIDPEFAIAAYRYGSYCKLSYHTLEELEKIMRCELDNWLINIVGGYVPLYLGKYIETIWDTEEGEYRWGCSFGDASTVVPHLIEDGVELYTRSWRNALFIWLAFEGELSLHYREYYEYKIIEKKAEACKDPALRELFLRAVRDAKIFRRVVEEYKYKVTLRGDSAYRFAKAMINLCHFYRSHPTYGGSRTEEHCSQAEKLRHLAEKAEPPLISEHLRQYWQLKAAQYGDAIYPTTVRIEALETGELVYPPKARREDGEARFFRGF